MSHFLPIVRTGDTTFTLGVTEDRCVGPLGHVFLFGGAGLGAAVLALEQTFRRGLVWATAQYISFARLGADVVLDVGLQVAHKVRVAGRREVGSHADVLERQRPVRERPRHELQAP